MSKTKAKSNWLDPATTAENEVLPKYLKWAWTSRALSVAVNALLIAYLTYYCTDMLGMKATTAGIILLASKVFDAVTDLVVGFIIDKTNTKLGKARPYEIFIVFAWLFTVVLFSAPEMSETATVIFVFILYTLINSVCMTFLGGSETVYLCRSIRNENNRVSVVSFSGGIVMIGSLIVVILIPQMIAAIGTTKVGWTIIALSFAIPFAIIGLMRFLFVKEVVVTEEKAEGETVKKETIGFKKSLKALSKNKYLFILAGMTLSVQLMQNITSVVGTYYYKYIVGDIGVGSIVAMTGFATPVFIFLFPALTKKFGTVKVLRAGVVLVVAGYAIRSIGGTFLGTFMTGTLLLTLGVLPITLLMSIYLIDCMDYGEWKTGVRVEGMISSVNNFCSKLGSGVASGLVGLIMGLSGYDGSLAVQSSTANATIIALMNVVPLLLSIVVLVLAIAYNLDKELPRIKAELAERKK